MEFAYGCYLEKAFCSFVLVGHADQVGPECCLDELRKGAWNRVGSVHAALGQPKRDW